MSFSAALDMCDQCHQSHTLHMRGSTSLPARYSAQLCTCVAYLCKNA